MVLPRMELQKIPYLRVLTSLRWRSRARFHDLLPAKEWNGDLTLLTDLLAFLRDENTYRLPREWRRTFSLLRLADMLGVDTFLAAVSRETCISVAMIDISNGINVVCHRLRGAYRVSEHLSSKKHVGICGVCSLPLAEIPPRMAKVDYSRAVSKKYMQDAWENPNVCPVCKIGLQPLPCIICKCMIECWGGDTRDLYLLGEKKQNSSKNGKGLFIHPIFVTQLTDHLRVYLSPL